MKEEGLGGEECNGRNEVERVRRVLARCSSGVVWERLRLRLHNNETCQIWKGLKSSGKFDVVLWKPQRASESLDLSGGAPVARGGHFLDACH